MVVLGILVGLWMMDIMEDMDMEIVVVVMVLAGIRIEEACRVPNVIMTHIFEFVVVNLDEFV